MRGLWAWAGKIRGAGGCSSRQSASLHFGKIVDEQYLSPPPSAVPVLEAVSSEKMSLGTNNHIMWKKSSTVARLCTYRYMLSPSFSYAS